MASIGEGVVSASLDASALAIKRLDATSLANMAIDLNHRAAVIENETLYLDAMLALVIAELRSRPDPITAIKDKLLSTQPSGEGGE